jgi:hypothetical protein
MGQRKTLANLDIILGILIGIAATMLITTSRWFWQHGLERYQELLSGCLALIGAAAAVGVVIRQINHAQEMEDERRSRKMYAARSMMPSALSALCRYARDCGLALHEALGEDSPPEPHQTIYLPHSLAVPPIPDASIAILRECLEFGTADIQYRIAELIKHLQVQYARITQPEELFDGRQIGGEWYYTLVADAIELYSRSEMLIPYARRDQEHDPGEPKLREMISAVRLCGYDEIRWPYLYSKLRGEWLTDYQQVRSSPA